MDTLCVCSFIITHLYQNIIKRFGKISGHILYEISV